jgi:hypothetical protein
LRFSVDEACLAFREAGLPLLADWFLASASWIRFEILEETLAVGRLALSKVF